jgi:glycosyltransferase involved in cell wall biosynthesis
MEKGVTIIICTYNGADRLGKTLEHLANQVVPGHIPWEVVLVDNASTDNSSEKGLSEWKRQNLSGIPFNVINESKAGKLYALQHAIRMARYEYLITCDDDNWLAEDYIVKIYNTFEFLPEVAAIGGKGIPVTEKESLPAWFKNFEVLYAIGPQGKKHGILQGRSVLWGAGLSTRKSVYLEMYKQYPSFLIGNRNDIIFAEDTEYCMRLILKGFKLFYDSTLIYHHFIADYKLNTETRDAYLNNIKNADEVIRKYYAAIRVMLKTKGHPGRWLILLLTSPISYLLSRSDLKKEQAKNILFHLLPSGIKSDQISVKIKAFTKGTS